MSKDRDDKFDATRPTLIVKYGTAHKYRPLDREVMILGRSAGCDVGLDAPDVAPVHCVLVRAIDGWHVRDCTGRGGTRLNGQSVEDAALTDEDVLQVGSFSFTLHLPPEERPLEDAGPLPDRHALQHARRSRGRMARLALRLRGRLAETAAAAAEQAEKQLAVREEELDRRAEEVRGLQRDVDARLAEMKQTARQIAEEKLALAERRGQIEAEMAGKRAEADAAVRASLEEAAAQARALEIRGRESACFAAYLRRLRQRLNEHEESLTARWEEWLREQQEASVAQAHQGEKIAREEALLRDQRAEVVRLMAEMRQMRRQPDPAVEALRQENEQLRTELAAAREEAKELQARADARQDEPALPTAAEGQERFRVELDTSRRVLDEQIRDLQGRFADLERSAVEAENHIAQERTRMAQERQELERLRGALWPADGRSPGAETLVDMPSPLHPVSAAADAEAPRAPSRASVASE